MKYASSTSSLNNSRPSCKHSKVPTKNASSTNIMNTATTQTKHQQAVQTKEMSPRIYEQSTYMKHETTSYKHQVRHEDNTVHIQSSSHNVEHAWNSTMKQWYKCNSEATEGNMKQCTCHQYIEDCSINIYAQMQLKLKTMHVKYTKSKWTNCKCKWLEYNADEQQQGWTHENGQGTNQVQLLVADSKLQTQSKHDTKLQNQMKTQYTYMYMYKQQWAHSYEQMQRTAKHAHRPPAK